LPWEQERVAEEIARLFRSNCFNSIKRNHEKETLEDSHPILKENLTNVNLKVDSQKYAFVEKML